MADPDTSPLETKLKKLEQQLKTIGWTAALARWRAGMEAQVTQRISDLEPRVEEAASRPEWESSVLDSGVDILGQRVAVPTHLLHVWGRLRTKCLSIDPLARPRATGTCQRNALGFAGGLDQLMAALDNVPVNEKKREVSRDERREEKERSTDSSSSTLITVLLTILAAIGIAVVVLIVKARQR